MKLRRLTGDDLARGYAILDGTLGAGREPDYSDPAVVGAYAFKYLARRVTSLFGALTVLGEPRPPPRVLDIASGSDATAIALHLRFPGGRIDVQANEPSEEMRALGDQFDLGPGIKVNRRKSTFAEIAAGTTILAPGSFDLIVMSTGFPYQTDWQDSMWNDLVARMAGAAAPQASVVVIEPQAKARILVGSEMALRNTERSRTQQWCCHDMPEHIRRAEVLRRSTAILHRYDPTGSPVHTWNPIRREYVIVGRDGAIAFRRANLAPD